MKIPLLKIIIPLFSAAALVFSAACAVSPESGSSASLISEASKPVSEISSPSSLPEETPSPSPSPSPAPTVTPVPLRTAQVTEDTEMLSDFEKMTGIRTLKEGESVSIAAQPHVLWTLIITEDGKPGYAYSEHLRDSTDGSLSETTLFESAFNSKTEELKELFPQDKYWNHMGTETEYGYEMPLSVTDIPCNHGSYGNMYCNFYTSSTLKFFSGYTYQCQCLGFAGYVSDYIFGKDLGPRIYSDISELRLGDQIRMREYEHSMTVIGIDGKNVTVAEVNENYQDCRISWNRVLDEDFFAGYSWDMEFITRYPEM